MTTSGTSKIPKILMISTTLILLGCADIIEKANRPAQPLTLTFVEPNAPVIKDLPAENVMFNALVCLEKDNNAQKVKLIGLLDLYGTPTNRHPALTPANNAQASIKAYEGVELVAGAGNTFELAVQRDDQASDDMLGAALKKINGDYQKEGKEVPKGVTDAVALLTLNWDIKNPKSVKPHYSGDTELKWGESNWPTGGVADMGAVFLRTTGVKGMERMAEVENHIAGEVPTDVLTDGLPKSLGGCQGPFNVKSTDTTPIDYNKPGDQTGVQYKEFVVQLELANGNSTSIKAADSGIFSLEPKYFIEPDKGAKAKHILNEGETLAATLRLIRRYAFLVGNGLTLTEVVEICRGYVNRPKPETTKK